jgi:hypothetical protein
VFVFCSGGAQRIRGSLAITDRLASAMTRCHRVWAILVDWHRFVEWWDEEWLLPDVCHNDFIHSQSRDLPAVMRGFPKASEEQKELLLVGTRIAVVATSAVCVQQRRIGGQNAAGDAVPRWVRQW